MATTTRPVAPEVATTGKRKRPWLVELYGTAVGKKYVMAITGIIGMLFIAGHMVGNLKLYLGGDHLDLYGEWLRTIGEPALPRTVFLWMLRSTLIVAVVLHIHSAWSLTRMNHAADRKYATKRDFVAAVFASRTVRWTGILVGLFIVFHLADLTWGTANGDFVRGAVRHNMVHSFRRPPVAITYIVANLALGVHLWHGAWSLFQSMGWNNPHINRARSLFAWAFASVIVLGNISFPLLIVTHAVTY
jgi:succinate dehydrogenase / fumarate reductase cytochrome b subunit